MDLPKRIFLGLGFLFLSFGSYYVLILLANFLAGLTGVSLH